MKDIDIAKLELAGKQLTLAVVKDGKLIFNSKKRGVLPLYQAVTDPGCDTLGASAADKVTGKGAALLCAYGKIDFLHTGIISKPAMEVLSAAGITVTYDNMVDFIENRTKDGMCPVETMTKDIENPDDALEPIEGFLKKIGAFE